MEFVAVLRNTLDDNKPSLFEVASEQQLNSLLPPTLRYLLTLATQRHPRYLLRILNSFDEIFALSMLLVERHHLRSCGGSFTENFYGLKRERVLRYEIPRASLAASYLVRDTLKLKSADVWKSLALLVGLPYLKRKLDEGYEVNASRALLGVAYTRLPEKPTICDRLLHCYRWFLSNLYPGVNAAYYTAILAFNLAYLFDRTKYHSPLMWIVGFRLRRMTRADLLAIESLASQSKPSAHQSPRSMFSPSKVASKASSYLSMLLPMSIFALKFLEWWYQSDFAQQLSRKTAEHIDLPPPVLSTYKTRPNQSERGSNHGQREEPDEESEVELTAQEAPVATPSMLPIYVVRPPSDASACPICQDKLVTPTACQTGILYCYSCIHRWIEGAHPKQMSFMEGRGGLWESGQGRCAVTGTRILGGTEGLRRIMV